MPARRCTARGVAYPSLTAAVRALRSSGARNCEIAAELGISQQSAAVAAQRGRPARGPGAMWRTVNIPYDLSAALDAVALKHGISRAALARRLLAALVEEPGTMAELLEDYP